MVTESRSGKANSHSTSAVHHAGQRRDVFCRRDAEVGVDDGAELRRRLQAGNDIRGDHRRHREYDRVFRRQRHRVVGKLQRRDPPAVDRQRPQAMTELHIGLALAQDIERRIDESVAQTVARDERPAGAPAGGERLADHGGGQHRGAFLRLGIQRRQQHRPDQPVKQAPLQSIAWQTVCSRVAPEQTRQRQIIAGRVCPARAGRRRKSTRATVLRSAAASSVRCWRDRRTGTRRCGGPTRRSCAPISAR